MSNSSAHRGLSERAIQEAGGPAKESSSTAAFLQGGGEMGERIRAFDWSRTPLGPAEQWPQSLKGAVAICLGSRMPIVIWWGREQAIQFYNDAYISFLGPTKHPAFLGRSGRECWREIWDTMGPLWDQVFVTGEATWSEDFLYVIDVTCRGKRVTLPSPIVRYEGQVGMWKACSAPATKRRGK